MQTTARTSAEPAPTSTSLSAKLFNLLASPGDVFAEVVAVPINLANWIFPTLFAGLAGMLVTATSSSEGHWLALVSACLGAFAGTIWSAFLLWFIGRMFLDTRFSFFKTLEVAGLTGIIPVLGTLVTVLLMAASGNPAARPALSIFAGKLDSGVHLHATLEALNFFHLWATTVLAIGLARLGGVSFKESAYWVFGYWLCFRVALILLA